jgi:hypothetical protein
MVNNMFTASQTAHEPDPEMSRRSSLQSASLKLTAKIGRYSDLRGRTLQRRHLRWLDPARSSILVVHLLQVAMMCGPSNRRQDTIDAPPQHS